MVGEMHCPSTAHNLTECNSSGWGNLRAAHCNYENVLWLTCFQSNTYNTNGTNTNGTFN